MGPTLNLFQSDARSFLLLTASTPTFEIKRFLTVTSRSTQLGLQRDQILFVDIFIQIDTIFKLIWFVTFFQTR